MKDKNFDAYKRMQREGHLDHFRLKYVGFVDGIFVDYDSKEGELLKRLRKTFPNKPRFYQKVPKDKVDVLDISPFNRIYFS